MRYVQKTSSQLLNEIHLYICCCQQKEALGVSTKIKAPITFINISIVILPLFCKINKKKTIIKIIILITTAILIPLL